MKQYYLYDENGYYLEPILVNDTALIMPQKGDTINDFVESSELLENITDIKPPSLYKAKFDTITQTWSESATQEEIEAILNQNETHLPTLEERVNALENIELSRLLGGV